MAARRGNGGVGKGIGYVRASTGDQKHTLSGQADRMRKRCQEEGIHLLSVGDNHEIEDMENIVDVVIEVESSTKEREKLLHVQERLERDEARCLVCAKIDRVGRSQFHLASIVHWAETSKIDIFSADEGWQVKDGRIVDPMLPFRIAMAQVELTNIRERTRQGLAAAKAKGVRLGHATENVELSKRCYEMRSAGLSWGQLVRQLEDDGVVTKQGCKVRDGQAYNMARRWAREHGLSFGENAVSVV